MSNTKKISSKLRRNGSLFDIWSLTHIAWGVLLGLWLNPVLALVLLILWEPLEIFILSPLLKRLFGITFGYETFRNSLSDIFFDAIGIAIAVLISR